MKRRRVVASGVALALACWVESGRGAEAPNAEQPWTLDSSSWETRGTPKPPAPKTEGQLA